MGQDQYSAIAGLGAGGKAASRQGPYGHWKTMTFIAALRRDRIDAPFVFDQPFNGAGFIAWVEQMPCPALRPGDRVIMDSLSHHRSQLFAQLSGPKARACCSCSPYSPDLNPIGHVFAKLKHLLRKDAKRTHEET